MPKISRLVTLELQAWEEARRKGINVSEACEAGLYRACGLKRSGKPTTRAAELLARLTPEEKLHLPGILNNSKGTSEHNTLFWVKKIRALYGLTFSTSELRQVAEQVAGQDKRTRKASP